MTVTPVSTQTGRLLLDYFYQHRDAMVETVKTLANIESPSTVPASQQPVLDQLQTEFERRGMRIRRLPGERTGGHLLAIPKQHSPAQPKQLMLGHCDTVWPLETLTTMPIYQRQRKLYGPGVYDMKAGITMMLFALQALQELEVSRQVLPLLFLKCDY